MLKSKKDKNSKSPKGDDTAAKMKGRLYRKSQEWY